MFNRGHNRTGRPWLRVGRLRSSAGWTLTELIVVIIMVGTLAAAVSMKLGSLTSGTNLRTAIDQVAGDLRFVQCRAMATLASKAATFPAGGKTYNLDGQIKNLPSGVTNSTVTVTVTFNSLGEYTNTTNATLDATITFNSGGGTSSVKIYAVSGNVEASY
jgi:Tfp pilus assembly protein FimT